MLNEEYIEIAEQFAQTLDGESHFISRYKVKRQNGMYQVNGKEHCFYTFHSLVYKVLPIHTVIEEEALIGPEMFELVRQAMDDLFGFAQEDDIVHQHYEAIRMYENTAGNEAYLNRLTFGSQVYEYYQSLISGHLDWESSVMVATEYLNNNLYTHENIGIDNLIILYPEVLQEERNRNVLDLFGAFYKWSFRHNRPFNVYLLTQSKEVFPYIDGQKLTKYSVIDAITNKDKEE